MFDVPNTRFVIMGDWEEGDPDGVVLRMRPTTMDRESGFSNYGMFHPSTQACLRAIAQYVKPGMRVADVGGGTGVLAAAMIAVGAEVTVYEQDPFDQADCFANAPDADLLGTFPDAWNGERYAVVVCSINLPKQVDPLLDDLRRAADLLLYTYDGDEVIVDGLPT